MHVLIFEPSYKGHHLAWVSYLLPALTELADRITLATTAEVPTTEQYEVFIGAAGIEHAFVSPPYASLRRFGAAGIGAANWWALEKVVRSHRPDHALVPTADSTIRGSAVLRAGRRWSGPPVDGGVIGNRFAYSREVLRDRVFGRAVALAAAAAPFGALNVIDPIGEAWLRRTMPWGARRVRLVPNPVLTVPDISREDARRELGLDTSASYVGCTGVMNARKGIDRLVRAFGALRPGGEERLLLAGKLAPEVRRALDELDAGARRRVAILDRFLDEREFQLALLAMDVVAVPYPRHVGSASILIQGVAAARPILGTGWGWIGQMIRTLGLGWTCDVETPAALARGLRRAFDGAEGFGPSEAAARFARYSTVDNFTRTWLGPLARRAGRPLPAPLSWSWVLEAAEAPPAEPRAQRSR